MPKKRRTDEEIISQRLVKAVAHPLRVKALAELTARGPLSPNLLKDLLDAPLGVTSYHVTKVLYEQCELLDLHHTEQRRGAVEHFYELKTDYLVGNPVWQRELPNFLQDTAAGASLQTFFDQAISALEDADELYAEDLITWRKVRVDGLGHHQLSVLLEGLMEQVAEVERASLERLRKAPKGSFEVVVALADLHVPQLTDG